MADSWEDWENEDAVSALQLLRLSVDCFCCYGPCSFFSAACCALAAAAASAWSAVLWPLALLCCFLDSKPLPLRPTAAVPQVVIPGAPAATQDPVANK